MVKKQTTLKAALLSMGTALMAPAVLMIAEGDNVSGAVLLLFALGCVGGYEIAQKYQIADMTVDVDQEDLEARAVDLSKQISERTQERQERRDKGY